jgi:hypothetical protein
MGVSVQALLDAILVYDILATTYYPSPVVCLGKDNNLAKT